MAAFYEMTSKTVVEVVQVDGKIAHLSDGGQAWLADLTRPVWLVQAEQEADNYKDERNTQQDAHSSRPVGSHNPGKEAHIRWAQTHRHYRQ